MKTNGSAQAKVGTRQFAYPNAAEEEKEFMILCPTIAENSGVIEALYALYYLPQSYKLLISVTGMSSELLYERIRKIAHDDSLIDRVTFKEKTGVPQAASPFLAADVVVYGSSDPVYTKGTPQVIVVFDIASKLSSVDGSHNFAVAASTPEAVASAILAVARKQQ